MHCHELCTFRIVIDIIVQNIRHCKSKPVQREKGDSEKHLLRMVSPVYPTHDTEPGRKRDTIYNVIILMKRDDVAQEQN